MTSSVIIGSILYKACVAIAIKLGMPSTDLKLITAVLFLVILVIAMERKTKVKNVENSGGTHGGTGTSAAAAMINSDAAAAAPENETEV